jgi:DNA-binding NarL/FixJ family response regulator
MTVQTATAPAKVFIVDDHPFMRRGLAATISDQDDMEVCGEASGKTEAMQLIAEAEPDLVVIDISLEDGNGIELIKDIKGSWPDMKMLVSSMHEESLFAERAVRAGAMGFVNKAEPVQHFVEALRRVASGRIYLSQRMTDRMLNQAISHSEEPPASPYERLSDREMEVFEMIGNGLGTKQIAGKLELSRKTVETYREHIKSKLNLANGTELTRHAVQWVLERG